MKAREYLIGIICAVLLIWGPVDHSWPAWLLIRVTYLIAIPATTWFLLSWIWKLWQPDSLTEDRLTRALTAATAGALLVGAILTAQEKYHSVCTQRQWTRDGQECVGDYESVPGPDIGNVVLLILGAGLFFFLACGRKNESK